MRTNDPYIEKLRIIIKQEYEDINPLLTPKDFLCFSFDLKERTGSSISVSTIKRFFGYIPYLNAHFSARVLHCLCRFVGYKTYDDFCNCMDNNSQKEVASHIVLSAKTLTKGDQLEIKVMNGVSNRLLLVTYIGGFRFQVVSDNFEWNIGDKYMNNNIIELKNVRSK